MNRLEMRELCEDLQACALSGKIDLIIYIKLLVNESAYRSLYILLVHLLHLRMVNQLF